MNETGTMPATTLVPMSDDRSLAVTEWAGTTAPILAIHGISSSSRLWLWLHAAAPHLSLVAPDLRGRGASPSGDGQSSISGHADDLVRVLDELQLESVDVVGMSMGGFVAVNLAAYHPDRVRSVTLLDGGLPFPPRETPVVPTDIPKMFKDRFDRLETQWPDVQTYAALFRSTAGQLLDADDPLIDENLAHDLEHGVHGGEVRLDLRILQEDALDLFTTDTAEHAIETLTVPTRMVFAQWGNATSDPMYPADYVEAQVAAHPALQSAALVEEVDHAAIIMSRRGALESAAVIEQSISRD
jgi:pimeloyl-ACP methyl ester carboxylesterase